MLQDPGRGEASHPTILPTSDLQLREAAERSPEVLPASWFQREATDLFIVQGGYNSVRYETQRTTEMLPASSGCGALWRHFATRRMYLR